MIAPKETRQREKEALLDIFDEGDHIEVVAELMAVAEKDINVSVTKDWLTISASRPDRSYHEGVALPAEIDSNKYTTTYGNNVLVVRLEKASKALA